MSGSIVWIFAGSLVTVLAIGFALFGGPSPRSRLRKRALRLAQGRRGGDRSGQTSVVPGRTIRRGEGGGIQGVESLVKRYLPRQSILRDRLTRTGYTITPGTYLLVCAGIVAAVLAAMLVTGRIPVVVAALIAVMVGAGLPHLVVAFLGARRRKRFLAVFPEAIDLIVRGLRSGLPVTESMAAVGREMPDPVGGEFRHVTDGVRFGQDLDDLLWKTARRLDLAEFKFFVISLSIQRETGGNLAETLANLSDIVRRRKQMQLKIKALSGEARASAFILGSLPFVMFAIVQLLNPGYANELFVDPRGLLMVGFGITSMLIGIGVIAKMVKFEI